MNPFKTNNRGISLAELLIAVALLGIGILAAVESFQAISKSIQTSKSRTLASNIAQEKMQIIMQKTYYEVLVTTAPQFRVIGSTSIAYDASYFAPETIVEGGIAFTRYTNVQVVQENSGSIQVLSPLTPDTGMRQITETVVWLSNNGYRFLSLQSVLNNPNTVMSNAVLAGTVRNAANTNGIPNAVVNAAENIGWRDTTSATGDYTFNLVAGSFNFQASAPGYFSSVINRTIAPNTTNAQDFNLSPMSSGTVSGFVWLDNHLVISQVVASTGPANSIEYVELYNPTTGPINMGSNAAFANANTWVVAFDAAGNAQSQPQLVYVSTFVPTYGFYLITNTSDGSGIACSSITVLGVSVSPDACWRSAAAPSHLLNCNTLPGGGGGCGVSQNAGGLGVGTNGGAIWSGIASATKIDLIGWTGIGSGASSVYETAAASTTSGLGMAAGETFVRRLDTTTAWNTSFGNAYDSDKNSIDFIDYAAPPFAPRTAATRHAPKTGTPAIGAVASATDNLSNPSSATVRGGGVNPTYAQFMIPGVATGTWNVFLDSSSFSAEIDSVTVVANSTTSVPNAVTTPVWTGSGAYNTVLSTVGTIGMISGNVLDALLQPIPGGIIVTAGGLSTTSGSNGSYYLRLPAGTYDLVANPGNANASYAIGVLVGQTVASGDMSYNANFSLPKGGRITGWITRDGVNALPGVGVTALDASFTPRANEVSGTNGQFMLINLTTGTYTVQPALDTKETATPTSVTVSVSAGFTASAGTFTVTGAMGSITGTVTLAGQPIKSGVLIVVSTMAIPIPLPGISSASLTTGAFYANSSKEDGTYSVDVRGSTSSVYNMAAFYTYLINQTPVISTRTALGVTVNAGLTTSGINFPW